MVVTIIFLILFGAFTFYRFTDALALYVALKVFLIKSWVVCYIPNLPLITVDRILFAILLIQYGILLYQRKISLRITEVPFYKLWSVLTGITILLGLLHFKSLGASIKGIFSLVFEMLLPFILVVTSFRTKKEVQKVFGFLLVAISMVTLYGLYNKWSGQNPFIEHFSHKFYALGRDNLVFTYGQETRFGVENRVQSFFFHAIGYGGILALWIPWILWITWKGRNTLLTIGTGILSIFIIVNLFFSNSRAALLSAIMACLPLLLYSLTHLKATKVKVLSAISVSVIAFVLFMNPAGFRTYIYHTIFFWQDEVEFTEYDLAEAVHAEANEMNQTSKSTMDVDGAELKGSTLYDRKGKYTYVWNAFQNKKWAGYGFGTVAKEIEAGNENIGGAESFWLKTLYETGILGTLAYIIFFLGIALHFLRKWIASNMSAWMYLLMLFQLMAYGLFISAAGTMNTFPFYILILALSITYTHVTEEYA